MPGLHQAGSTPGTSQHQQQPLQPGMSYDFRHLVRSFPGILQMQQEQAQNPKDGNGTSCPCPYPGPSFGPPGYLPNGSSLCRTQSSASWQSAFKRSRSAGSLGTPAVTASSTTQEAQQADMAEIAAAIGAAQAGAQRRRHAAGPGGLQGGSAGAQVQGTSGNTGGMSAGQRSQSLPINLGKHLSPGLHHSHRHCQRQRQ
jgi:hypothetical protein